MKQHTTKHKDSEDKEADFPKEGPFYPKYGKFVADVASIRNVSLQTELNTTFLKRPGFFRAHELQNLKGDKSRLTATAPICIVDNFTRAGVFTIESESVVSFEPKLSDQQKPNGHSDRLFYSGQIVAETVIFNDMSVTVNNDFIDMFTVISDNGTRVSPKKLVFRNCEVYISNNTNLSFRQSASGYMFNQIEFVNSTLTLGVDVVFPTCKFHKTSVKGFVHLTTFEFIHFEFDAEMLSKDYDGWKYADNLIGAAVGDRKLVGYSGLHQITKSADGKYRIGFAVETDVIAFMEEIDTGLANAIDKTIYSTYVMYAKIRNYVVKDLISCGHSTDKLKLLGFVETKIMSKPIFLFKSFLQSSL